MTTKELKQKIMTRDNLFIIFSQRTRMPFIFCDPETMDDQIYVYFSEEEAKKETETLANGGDLCRVFVLQKRAFLPFFLNTYSMGVNCIVAGFGTKECTSIQLEELVQRTIKEEMKNSPSAVENPALNLTMLYFMQELSSTKPDMAAAKELEQEMTAHFQKAKLLIPFQKDKKGIFLMKDDQKFQPVFTDFFEYDKFDREKKLLVIGVDAPVLLKNFPKEADGIIINPSSASVILNVNVAKN